MPKLSHPVKVALAVREFCTDLAPATGASRGMLDHCLNGRATAPSAVKDRIGDYLDRPADELFGDIEQYVAASRAAQGLSRQVTDPHALAEVSRALRGAS